MQLLRREFDGLVQFVDPTSLPLGAHAERLAVELPGALLEWSLTAPPGALPVITLRDADEVDWFWQVFGQEAHLVLLDGAARVDVAPDQERLGQLQCLGRALWARAWWPASEREGIPALDDTVLAAEIVTLIASLDELAGDTLDGELEIVRAAHSRDDYAALLAAEDPAVRGLGERLFAVFEWELPAEVPELARRADYALAASGTQTTAADALASGTAPLEWQRVPARIFDASETAIHWSVDACPDPVLHVLVELLPGADASGIPVVATLLDKPASGVSGSLDAGGAADLPLPLSAAEVWSQNWDALRIRVGAAGDGDEDAAVRDRVRAYARARLVDDDALTLAAERQAAAEDF